MDRRDFLGATARLAALAALGQLGACTQSQPLKFDRDPFTLGVASSDPLPDGVVLWTRLAPDPLHGGGMSAAPVDVAWEVARDEAMKDVARSGVTTASPDLAHSVHVEVSGLEADRPYWYRFRAGDAESPTGRTHTSPPAGSPPQRIRFAFASCQNYTQGYYTAHANLAREDLDAVVFLGDYIYEGTPRGILVRDYAKSGWSFTLADYRDRYAQYKSDRDLQTAHAAFPWIMTWDDHEVENNYAGGIEKDDQHKAALLERAAAYQAYYEHQPLRGPRPQGPDLRLYRSISYGDLVTFFVLDTRQYRSPEVSLCREEEETPSGYCPASLDPKRTVVGSELLGTSISSEGDASPASTQFDPSTKNPQLRFFDNHRGYVRCSIERSRLTADFRAVSTVRQPTASVSTIASFAIDDGRPGAHRI